LKAAQHHTNFRHIVLKQSKAFEENMGPGKSFTPHWPNISTIVLPVCQSINGSEINQFCTNFKSVPTELNIERASTEFQIILESHIGTKGMELRSIGKKHRGGLITILLLSLNETNQETGRKAYSSSGEKSLYKVDRETWWQHPKTNLKTTPKMELKRWFKPKHQFEITS
jgi:hypothetical protein